MPKDCRLIITLLQYPLVPGSLPGMVLVKETTPHFKVREHQHDMKPRCRVHCTWLQTISNSDLGGTTCSNSTVKNATANMTKRTSWRCLVRQRPCMAVPPPPDMLVAEGVGEPHRDYPHRQPGPPLRQWQHWIARRTTGYSVSMIDETDRLLVYQLRCRPAPPRPRRCCRHHPCHHWQQHQQPQGPRIERTPCPRGPPTAAACSRRRLPIPRHPRRR